MSNQNSKKRRLKYVMLALACTATFSLTGMAAACKKTENTDDEEEKKTSVEDTQLLKNGNFEVLEVPDKAVYLINTPASWTKGGSSSYTMSGIIGTSEKAWADLTDTGLADKLDKNNDLNASDSNYKDEYVDYNGMKSSDIPYKDTHAALDKDSDEDEDVRKAVIDNPGTHYNVTKEDGKLYATVGGEKKEVYEDEKGDYYLTKDGDKYEDPISHVLMLHNYATARNGIAQNYSSVSVELPANTAAEISLWVKTEYLKFNQGEEVKQDRGANITMTHTVGSTTLDDFTISGINTQKLIKDGKASENYGGWVEYTVYVNSCDFASSNITLKLGLGESDYLTEGYAFFDDVTVKKFAGLDDVNCTYTANKNKIKVADKDASASLLSDADEKKFIADSYERNGGAIKDERFSKNFHYYLDLASVEEYKHFGLDSATAGLTVDGDGYVSATQFGGKLVGFTSAESDADAKLPKDFKSLKTENDLLAKVKVGYQFTDTQTKFSSLLNDALASSASLPKANTTADNSMLVMLSEYGAAYTSSLDVVVGTGEQKYQIVSFWVKTSDLNGGTAATIKLTQKDKDDNTVNVTLDSTGIKTDIDEDNEDIYDGWVQCFFFIHNEEDAPKTLSFEFNFGNTTVKDTTVSNYKAGWVALANVQTLTVDEDTFAYTGSTGYSATLTVSKDDEKKTSVFDEVYGSQTHEIENSIVNPSAYKGVNGGSSSIVNNGSVSLPFDDINKNPDAGLINKEYFVKGNYGGDWYSGLLGAFNASSLSASAAWNEIFGQTSIQPLIIVNSLREQYVRDKSATADNYKQYYIKNEDGGFEPVASDAEFSGDTVYYSAKDVMNYGFIGSEQTIAADGYSTVSVKVKVSAGAVAYVYLVDTAAGKNVLGFSAPSYTFRYDEDGNVLKGEPKKDASISEQRENILYTLRDDGLYEDKTGKLFANVWNYTKVYKDESVTYYDASGATVAFDDLKEGETYYNKNDGTTVANHYLAASDGTKLYEYRDGEYYYLVEGKATSKVTPFNTGFATYDFSGVNEEYFVKIDGNEAGVAGKWITVNFVINAGSEAKNYRLELWSGKRDSMNSDECDEGSAVIFDYSYSSVSDSALMSWYEEQIIDAYRNVLKDKNLLASESIESSSENIRYYKKLVDRYVAEGKIASADVTKYEILNAYRAYYYTYSLYDSANFHPFNKDVAGDNENGYDYDVNDYSETLAYLWIKDDNSYTVFTDYSTIDKTFDLDTDDGSDNGTDDSDSDSGDSTTVWLLVSSILLVVALVFAIVSIMLKDMIKKSRRNKVTGKNNYNQQKRNRYMRRLHIKKDDAEEIENPLTETPAEDVPADETPAEGTPAEEAPAEEVPVEQPVEEAEQPADETPAEQPVEDVPAEKPDGENQ